MDLMCVLLYVFAFGCIFVSSDLCVRLRPYLSVIVNHFGWICFFFYLMWFDLFRGVFEYDFVCVHLRVCVCLPVDFSLRLSTCLAAGLFVRLTGSLSGRLSFCMRTLIRQGHPATGEWLGLQVLDAVAALRCYFPDHKRVAHTALVARPGLGAFRRTARTE